MKSGDVPKYEIWGFIKNALLYKLTDLSERHALAAVSSYASPRFMAAAGMFFFVIKSVARESKLSFLLQILLKFDDVNLLLLSSYHSGLADWSVVFY